MGLKGKNPSGNWDLAELLARVDNDHEFLRELLRIFREDSQANLQQAKAALAQADFPALTRTAHTMKGMLRNLSMTRAAEIAAALETSARDGQREKATALVAQLEAALAELLPEVDAQLAEVRA